MLPAYLDQLCNLLELQAKNGLTFSVDSDDAVTYGATHDDPNQEAPAHADPHRSGQVGAGPAGRAGGRGPAGNRRGSGDQPQRDARSRFLTAAGKPAYDWRRELEKYAPPAEPKLETEPDEPETEPENVDPEELRVQPGDWPIKFSNNGEKSLKGLSRVPQYDAIRSVIRKLSRHAGQPPLVKFKVLEGQAKKPAEERFWRAHAGSVYRIIYAIRPEKQIWVFDIVHKQVANDRYYAKVARMRVSDMRVAQVSDLMEATAMRILAGLRETNMIQFMLADEMHEDFIDWAEEFGQRFREIYENDEQIRRAIDSGHPDHQLIEQLSKMIKGPG